MDNMNLTINDYAWHRNGSTGDPFYTIQFTLIEDGKPMDLVAITDAVGDYETGAVHQWKVIDPSDPNNNWRGDRIGHHLKPMMDHKLKEERDNPER